jgi:hypothetical protein
MKTVIDNTERVFMVHSYAEWESKKAFCNLSDLPMVIEDFKKKGVLIKIKECWNNKFERISKKNLNAMFKANQIDYRL